MILTGKCKQDFEKWLLTNYKEEGYKPNKDIYYQEQENKDFIHEFNIDIESKKYGVMEDFFDSVGLQIGVKPYICKLFTGYEFNVNTFTNGVTYDTRPEARTKAIEKANELYNNQ